jgi:hypothetical protein
MPSFGSILSYPKPIRDIYLDLAQGFAFTRPLILSYVTIFSFIFEPAHKECKRPYTSSLVSLFAPVQQSANRASTTWLSIDHSPTERPTIQTNYSSNQKSNPPLAPGPIETNFVHLLRTRLIPFGSATAGCNSVLGVINRDIAAARGMEWVTKPCRPSCMPASLQRTPPRKDISIL